MDMSSNVPHEIKVVYINRRKLDLIECNKALETGDFLFLEKVGHQVKGNAQSFGYDFLASYGVDLETAAKSKDLSRAKTIVFEFNKAVEKIKI